MKAKELYSVGIYLRLSRDDSVLGKSADKGGGCSRAQPCSCGKHGKAESNSIGSQRDIACAFVRSRKDMEIHDIYVDDGYSGANFDRPEFKRMMEDVNAGKVDCIVVKDLSRFGREYIEAGRLIQKTFPALNVRFIAITDHFDSLTADYNESALVLPVKNFVNDAYCRDISDKVKSHQKIKREKGEFIGAFTVYGYRKDCRNKHRLIPDEYAAQIIRNIFTWKTDGMSTLAIAERLNGLGILSPMEYKKSKGEKYTTGFRTGIKAKWSAVAVRRILVNEIYTGTLEQGKSEKINYKIDKYRLKSKDEWVRVEGTHDAIIAREDFDNVQRLLQTDTRAGGGAKQAHLFSGLLFCGDCGEPMIRRTNRYKGTEKVRYICSTRNKGEGCTRHSVAEEELKQALLAGLRLQTELFTDKEKVLSHMEKLEISFEEIRRFEQEIARLSKEQEQYLSLRSGLYEDLKNGVITQDDFHAFRGIYEEKYAKTQETIAGQEEMIRSCLKEGVASGMRLQRFKEEPGLTELTRDALVTFIEKIYMYEDKRIGIKLKAGGRETV